VRSQQLAPELWHGTDWDLVKAIKETGYKIFTRLTEGIFKFFSDWEVQQMKVR
jgi:hypothetical protein